MLIVQFSGFKGYVCVPKSDSTTLSMPMGAIGAALIFNGSFIVVAGQQIINSQPVDIRNALLTRIPAIIGLSRYVKGQSRYVISSVPTLYP